MAKKEETPLETQEAKAAEGKTPTEVATETTAEINKAAETGQAIQAVPTFTPTINTTQSVVNTMTTQQGHQISDKQIREDLEYAKKAIQAKGTKSVSIPKQLAATLGDTLPACINGVCINVPVNGEEYDVPAPYVEIIRESLKTIHSGDVRDNLAKGANDGFLTIK